MNSFILESYHRTVNIAILRESTFHWHDTNRYLLCNVILLATNVSCIISHNKYIIVINWLLCIVFHILRIHWCIADFKLNRISVKPYQWHLPSKCFSMYVVSHLHKSIGKKGANVDNLTNFVNYQSQFL